MWWLFLLSSLVMAATESTDEKMVGIYYFSPMFGHVHQSSVRTSASLTTIQCSHPVKVLESSKVHASSEWAYVEVAEHRGFILKEYLAPARPGCFQAKYPRFFDSLNLDLSDLYYWGRLNDQYISGETRVK